MSGIQVPNHANTVTNITSDGQGHYVVFHQQQDAQTPLTVQQQQLSQQNVVSSSQPISSMSTSNVALGLTASRPRILTRPSGTLVTTPVVLNSPPGIPTVRKPMISSFTRIPLQPSGGACSSAQSHPQPISSQMLSQSPQVVTILDEEPNSANLSTAMGMNQIQTRTQHSTGTSVTIYANNPPVTLNETVLGPGTVNYATLTSVDNFQQMNNIYVEALPTNLDASSGTVIMGSDNQLYNIQNNGDTVLFCPSTADHGSINLMPLIDTANSGTPAGQIHFPVGDVMTGNGVYELIALPTDSSITSFSDQPILNLASTASYGTIIPISQQQDPNTQYVFSVHDDNGMTTLGSVGGVLQQHDVPLSVDSSSMLTFMPSSSVTTMAPSGVSEMQENTSVSTHQPKTQRTYITVVDDFSDLIKTEENENGNNTWSFVSMEQHDQDHSLTEAAKHSQAVSGDETKCFQVLDSADNEDSKDSVVIIEDEGITASSNDMGSGTSFGIVKSSLYEQIQSAFNGGDGKPGEPKSIRVMVDGQYFEEISVRQAVDTVHVSSTPANIGFKLDSTTIKKISFPASAIQSNRLKLPQLKVIPKAPIQLRARSLPSLAKKPSEHSAASAPKNLNDFTTITLRNTMERVNSEIPPAPLLIEKPKPKVPSIPSNVRSNRHPGIPMVEWVDGLGKFQGLSGKIRVDETTGTMEMVDFNPADHQRRIRIPLSVMKEQPKVVKKFEYSKGKAVSSKKLLSPDVMKKESVIAEGKIGNASGDSSGEDTNSTSEIVKEESNAQLRHGSDNERYADVIFCITCGTLATKEKEFSGKRCKKCFDAEYEEVADAEEESPVAKFKIPKGITITKTPKRLGSSQSIDSLKQKRLARVKQEPDVPHAEFQPPSSNDADPEKKNQLPLLKLEPALDAVGITVTPIFQTPSVSPKLNTEKEESIASSKSTPSSSVTKHRKYHRRSLIEQKKMKRKSWGADKVTVRKRTLEKVLNTKTKHAKKSLMGSGSSLSDAKSPGPEELTDSEKDKTSQDSSAEFPAEQKRSVAQIDFNWPKYLQETNSKAAPSRFFRQPAFPNANPFKIGMMLEAVDPQHQSLFCVASIADVQGYRIRLHLIGYGEIFDFWVNADSYDIFPTGWCADNNQVLEPPPNCENFSWEIYLQNERLVAADPEFFAITKETAPSPPNEIQRGMRLEAVDIRNMSLTCVATVQNIINDRLLIHFDSWDSIYDYWTDTSSPFIHPVGYCKKMGIELTPPKNYKGVFLWETYLKERNADPVPSQSIRPLPPIGFKKNMKLECVDKRNPFLIRVATIVDVQDHQILIHFDGWSSDYDFQVYECSGDIHPIGWCAATGHPLQVPPDASEPWSGSCSIFGCLGVGHIKGYKFMTHNAEFNCPYSPANLKKDFSDSLPDRFLSYKKSVIVTQQHENSNASRRGSMEAQTTFARAAKLRSEKRKSLAAETPAIPVKRKYTKRKSEAEILMKSKGNSASEGEDSNERDRTGSLLLRRLSARQVKPIPSPPVSPANKLPPVTIEPVPSIANEMPKRIIIPNIESTITPVLPPATLPGGATVQVHWEDIMDSVVKKEENQKGVTDEVSESVTPPEFTLPSSTTMTPIPTPTPCTSSTIAETFHPKTSTDHLLMLCSQKSGGELTISQCRNDNDSSVGVQEDKAAVCAESDYDLPLNYTRNIRLLNGIVGKLNTATVSKWKTKNVVLFVRRIPGCLEASQKFNEHQIDGEAFLLMTMTDFSEVMGLKMGPSIKLIQAIRLMHMNGAVTPLSSVSITPIPTSV